jgi:hypothetical protein
MTPKCRKQMPMILRGSRALVASVTSPRRGEVASRCVAEIKTIILMFETQG